MSHGHRRLPQLIALGTPNLPAGVPDTELLARWVAHRDEAAFELLVRRHGPTVLAACRRLLNDANDVDDAFQAAFLILARKAGSVTHGEVLAAWLHRVAYRVALRVRGDRTKRIERQDASMVDQLPAPPPSDPAWTELLRVLDEEVDRLPARHRVVFVLCCLEGKTGEEAGKLLGCPPGTISSRLTRARERLRDRLTRRGFAPAALLLALGGDAFATLVPNSLVDSVMQAAPAFCAATAHTGPPSRPATIAEGVVKTMFVQKLKLIPVFLVTSLVVGAVLAGSGTNQEVRQNHNQATTETVPNQKTAAPLPVVRLTKPQAGGVDRATRERCVAQAGAQADLFPAVSGVLKEVKVDLGNRVKAGQVLAEIDAPSLALDEQLAHLAVNQAQALLKEAQARIATAKAEMQAAKGIVKSREVEVSGAKTTVAYREKQLARIMELRKQNAVDSKLVDELEDHYLSAKHLADAAVVGVENAKIDVATKQAKLIEMEAGVTRAEANVAIAKIGLQKAQLAVAQTRITAPFDGIVATSNASNWQFIRLSDSANAKPLFTVMRTTILRLIAAVPSHDAGLLKPGITTEVMIDAFPNLKLTAKIARVGFAVDPNTSTVRVEIDLPNPEEQIRPGMTGDVTFTLAKGHANALRIPAGAVFQITGQKGEQIAGVYVYKNGKAHLTPVKKGYSNGSETEVLSGLTAEDLVITHPTALVPQIEVDVEAAKPSPPK